MFINGFSSCQQCHYHAHSESPMHRNVHMSQRIEWKNRPAKDTKSEDQNAISQQKTIILQCSQIQERLPVLLYRWAQKLCLIFLEYLDSDCIHHGINIYTVLPRITMIPLIKILPKKHILNAFFLISTPIINMTRPRGEILTHPCRVLLYLTTPIPH